MGVLGPLALHLSYIPILAFRLVTKLHINVPIIAYDVYMAMCI